MNSNFNSPREFLKQLKDKEARRALWRRPAVRWSSAAAAVVLGWMVFGHKHKGKVKAAMAVPVGVAAAKTEDMPVYLDGLGSAAAYYTVTLHTRVDGQIMTVNFKEGQYVHEGDLLAQIDPRPYQAALDQAKGQLAKDQATLDDANLDLARYKGLLAENAIPKQQYDTQVATVGQAQGAEQNDKAAVEAAQLNLTYARITAPISGRVGLRLVDPGNIVHAADANGMLVITQLQPITVVFTLPEDDLPSVMQRMTRGEKLQVLAYNRDKSQLLAKGTLLTVDNQIDPTTGTSKLKAVFDNKENTLFPNQFVNVRLLLETRKDQIVIPSVAIQQGAQGKFAYVVKADKTVEARAVTTGVCEGTDCSVEGVQDGESVVIDGADSLQPGSSVRVDKPATPDATAGAKAAAHQ